MCCFAEDLSVKRRTAGLPQATCATRKLVEARFAMPAVSALGSPTSSQSRHRTEAQGILREDSQGRLSVHSEPEIASPDVNEAVHEKLS